MVCADFLSQMVMSLPSLFLYVDDNKTKIAKSGALVPLTRLARSKDMRVQRNATGALLNMTHSGARLNSAIVLVAGGTKVLV